jgi:hypothetical protein
MAIRRNSPSFPAGKVGMRIAQTNIKLIFCQSKAFKGESSPFTSSPQNGNATNSPRLFWQGRDPASPARESLNTFESHSQIPMKRSSIENLMKASRVKNSNMFAREQNKNYDPSNPNILDRPLASGRPLSMQNQGKVFGSHGMAGMRKENEQADVTIPADSKDHGNTFLPPPSMTPLSPSKSNTSPAKSSLSKRTGANARHMGFDPDTGIWEDDDVSEKKLPEGRVLHRHAKSVTFDQAPPQINEYEMTTPDQSSVASGSRESSYDSVENDEDVSFERGSSFDREDSFDASLEDTDKTPVVLPEDWRFMSPDHANTELSQHERDVFEDEYGSPAPTAQPGSLEYRPHQISVNSVDSNGQPRPLPPLPSLMQSTTLTVESYDGLSSTIERMSNGQRSLPSPPQAASISKSYIRRMSGGSFSLEERLRIMALQDQDNRSEAEKQRDRRMRRAGSKDASPAREQISDRLEQEQQNSSPNTTVVEHESNAPRISRESILRRLRSEQDLNTDKPHEQSGNSSSDVHAFTYDPDTPIPSLEDPTQDLIHSTFEKQVVIKEEEVDDNDLYSIPDMYIQESDSELDAEDDTSQYSQTSFATHLNSQSEEGQETPRAQSPIREPEKKSMPLDRMSLPDFTNFGEQSSFDLGLDSYMTPPKEQPPSEKAVSQMPTEHSLPDLNAVRQSIQRPFTPEDQLQPPRFSLSFENNDSEPGTPESVIRHPIAPSSQLFEISEPEATIRAPGTKLKTRPSFTPADTQSMAATRRQVSGQMSGPPPIPERHHQRPSLTQAELLQMDTKAASSANATTEDGEFSEQPTKRVSSLIQLEIPHDPSDYSLGFGLEKEFDRVVEAQKVAFKLSLQRLYYLLMVISHHLSFLTRRTQEMETFSIMSLPCLPH